MWEQSSAFMLHLCRCWLIKGMRLNRANRTLRAQKQAVSLLEKTDPDTILQLSMTVRLDTRVLTEGNFEHNDFTGICPYHPMII